jgi:hypothetical protein
VIAGFLPPHLNDPEHNQWAIYFIINMNLIFTQFYLEPFEYIVPVDLVETVSSRTSVTEPAPFAKLFRLTPDVAGAAARHSPTILSVKSLAKFLSSSAAAFCISSGYALQAASEAASLQVPPIIRIESGTNAPLTILPGPDEGTLKTLVVIRGMPWNVSLTAGRLFPSGVWALKVSEVKSAQLVTASGTRQVAQLNVSLVTLDGDHLSKATVILEIVPKPGSILPEEGGQATLRQGSGAVSSAPLQEAPAPQKKRRVSLAELDKVVKLMDRGDKHLTEGKIASARRFYQLAAEMGWPDGALAIARTYDADFLGRFPIIGGIEPDEALARKWYETAREISLEFLPLSEVQRRLEPRPSMTTE